MPGPPARHTGPVRLEVRQELADLASTWDELVAAQPLPSPFLLSWWVDNAAGGTPLVVCCWDGDELVGGAAFELDRLGRSRASVERVQFLGQGPLAPDHLDVIGRAGRRDDVAVAVAEWLLHGNRVVDLDGLAASSALGPRLGGRELRRVAAPHLRLESGTDPLAGRPGQLRSTVRRTERRLAKEGFGVRRCRHTDAGDAVDRLLELHGARWGDDSGFLPAATSRFRAAVVAGMAAGRVEVFELAGEEGVIASEMVLVAGTRVAFYQAGRRTDRRFRGSGSVLRAATVRWAAESGHDDYDLLRGDEPYKADWSDGHREVLRVRIGAGAGGRTVAGMANASHRTGPVVLSLAERAVGRDVAERVTRRIVTGVRAALRSKETT